VGIISVFLQDFLIVGAALLFASMTLRPRPWHFGLRIPSRPSAIGWAVLAFTAFVLFAATWSSLIGAQDEKDTLPDQLGATTSDTAMIIVAVLVCVVAPFTEEFFFRGFFFRAWANWRGPWPAALITGIAFGLVHAAGSPTAFLLPLSFLGFALCVLYMKTGSIVPCIAVHSVNNCIAYGSAIDWTWQTPLALALSLSILALALAIIRRRWGAAPPPASWNVSSRWLIYLSRGI
jgi:membrane protease YdiL (CAAX protease family)